MNNPNVKWHRMTAEDVISELHTNAACGLNCKAARSLSRKQGANTIFDVASQDLRFLWRPILTDPILWVLLGCCLLTLSFSEIGLGLSALIFFAFGLFLFFRLYQSTKELEIKLSKYRIPWVSVLRGGKRRLISARALVAGDILLLKAGDIVPCDCRLLNAHELSVQTLQPDEKGLPQWVTLQKNADFVYPYGNEEPAPLHVNMLYGGSRILQGEAAAIAVAIGEYTFLGAMQNFRIPAETTARIKNSSYAALRPYLRIYGLFLLVLLLPLTVIGALVLPQGQTLMGLFLSLIAMLGCGAPTVLMLYFQAANLRARVDAFHQIPAENRIVPKSAHAMDRLATLTDVFVMGSCGIADGKLHLQRCATGRGALKLEKGTPYISLQPLCEAFLLLSQAREAELEKEFSFPEWDDSVLCDELISFSDFDTEALQLRVRYVAMVSGREESDVLLEVQTNTDTYRLAFSEEIGRWSECSNYEDDGTLYSMDENTDLRMRLFCNAAHAEGCRLITIIREKSGRKTLLGVLAVKEQVQQTLPSVLEELERSGVRVTFFFPKETEETLRYLSSVCMTERLLTQSERLREGLALEQCLERYRVIVGTSRKEIVLLVRELQKKKHRIAVVGCATEELPLLQISDLAISCDSTHYHKKNIEETMFTNIQEDGQANSERTSQINRRYADVLISRAKRLNGGLSSVLQAIALGRGARVRMWLLLSVLATSQLFRVLVTVLSVCFGIGFMNGAQVLFGGFVIEAILTCWILLIPIPQSKLRKCLAFDGSVIEKRLLKKSFWLPVLCSALGCVLYAALFWLLGVITSSDVSAFLFLTSVLFQIVTFIRILNKAGIPLNLRHHLHLLAIIFLPIALGITQSQIFPAIAAFSGLGSRNLIALLAIPLSVLIYLLSELLVTRVEHRTSK